MKLIESVWSNLSYLNDVRHCSLIREFMALHVLCPSSCPLKLNPETGQIGETIMNVALHWSRVFEYPWALCKGEVEPYHTVLDAGAGAAIFQYAIAQIARKCISLDKDPESQAKVEHMKNRLKLNSLEFQLGDLLDIPYPDDYFDRVFCVSVMEHIPDWRTAFKELCRVVKPGGYLILTCDIIGKRFPDEELKVDTNIFMEDVPELTLGVTPDQTRELVSATHFGGCMLYCLCNKYQK